MVGLMAEATQILCSQVQPHFPDHANRHDEQRRDGGNQRLFQYTEPGGCVTEERRGSYHFVQGWKQQGHQKDVSLFVLASSSP